jgi:lysozyme family protein
MAGRGQDSTGGLMATWTYDEALRRLLVHEGGYSNHPSDPGGPTNFGITIFDYRKYINSNGTASDVRNMSVQQAKAIYKSKYWNAMRCDDLPPGVDYAIFDYGVNSGTGRAPKVLKRVLGIDASNSTVTSEVISAAKKRDAKALVEAICNERLRFLQALRTWPTFGAGWGRRVKEVRQAGIAMATRGTPTTQKIDDGAKAPGRGQVPEPKVAKEVIRTGVPSGGAVVGVGFWGWIAAHPKTSIVIVLAILAGIVFALVKIKQWRERKQETPMVNTPAVPEIAS